MTPEKKIQNAAIKFADRLRIPAIRFAFRPGVEKGWPDVLFLIPGGRPLFIEFKAFGKKATRLQKHRIEQLKRLGYDVHVCDREDEACETIARALETARLSAKGG